MLLRIGKRASLYNDRPRSAYDVPERSSLQALSIVRTSLLLAMVALLLAGCRRDRLFSDDPNASLSFSQDTVLFDTIFTTVGSVTKRFVARNLANRAVRVDIALQGGSPSPYRINVDGSSGISFQDVEILAGDSVFVFVEATLGPGGVNTPFILEDHILFNTNGNEQTVLLLAWGQDAHFHYPDQFLQGFPPFSYIVGGLDENGEQVCGETVTWVNDKPHVIYGYAVVDGFNGEGVPCGNRLIIEAGTRIHVHGGGGLWVFRNGQITAVGTLNEPITFQSDRLEPFYDELPGQWDRIWINEGPSGADNHFEHVRIKNALVGIQAETWPLVPDAPTSAAKLILNNVSIRNCSAAGILSRNYRITSNNLLVGDCGQHSVALTGGGEYYFNHSTIANYWNYGVRQTPAFIMTNTYQNALTGAIEAKEIVNSEFLNGIVHGSNLEEFQLEFNSALTPDVRFDWFMVKTESPASYFNDNPNWFPTPERVYRNQNPGFVSTAERDFRLVEGAFARNKGTSTAGGIQDLVGNNRNCDAGHLGQPGGYDLGCFEWCP